MRITGIISALLAAAVLLIFGIVPDIAMLRPSLPLSFPVYAAACNNGFYVIDDSHRRIVAVDKDGMLRFVLNGGQRTANGFFLAVDIAPDGNGGLFILNGVPDELGSFFIQEEILHYDSGGHFTGCLYELKHEKPETVLMHRGRIKRLKYDHNTKTLSFFQLEKDKVSYCRLQTADDICCRLPSLEPDRDIADIVFNPNTNEFIWTQKNGQICAATPDPSTGSADKIEILYDGSSASMTNGKPVPWELDIDNSGNICFVDLTGRSVIRILPDKTYVNVFTADSDIYRLNVSAEGHIAVATASEAIIVDGKRLQKLSEICNPPSAVCRPVLQIASYLVLFITGICYIRKFSALSAIGRSCETLLTVSIVICAVIATILLTMSGIVSSLIKVHETDVCHQIEQLAATVSLSVDGDLLKKIQTCGDYRNEEYLTLRSKLDKQFDQNNPLMTGYVYAVYTVHNSRLFAQIYQDAMVNPCYPFDWFDDPEQGYSKAEQGENFVSTAADISGDWIYALAPIRDKAGNVEGILEISRECHSFRTANQQLVYKLLLETGIFLVIVILVIIELVFAVNCIRQYYRNQFFAEQKFVDAESAAEIQNALFHSFSPCYFTRTLAFLYFTADSVSLSFLPLAMKSFYQPIALGSGQVISENVVLAIPYTVIMFSFGIGTMLAGRFSSQHTFRKIMYTGFACSSLGFLTAASAFDMLSFTLSQCLIGFGGGLTFIAIRQIVILEKNTELNETGYANFYAGWVAGINAGIIIGAVIADHLGYAASFMTAFGITVLCFLFEYRGVRFYTKSLLFNNSPGSYGRGTARSIRKTLRLLLSEPKVSALFLCNTIPTYILVSFSYYYFPLLADKNNSSVTAIGGILLAAGLLTVYLGPPLTTFIRRYLNYEQSVYLTATLWSCSALIYVFTGSYIGAVFTVLALGLIDGFAEPLLNFYYLSLDRCKEAGQEIAVGYYELVSRLGQTAGPMFFAGVLIFGERTGITAICVICLLCTATLFCVNRMENRK